MSLAGATEAYQAMLETMRRVDDGGLDLDEYEHLSEDLGKAKREMEIAWLEATAVSSN